jgi:hypothetical protein
MSGQAGAAAPTGSGGKNATQWWLTRRSTVATDRFTTETIALTSASARGVTVGRKNECALLLRELKGERGISRDHALVLPTGVMFELRDLSKSGSWYARAGAKRLQRVKPGERALLQALDMVLFGDPPDPPTVQKALDESEFLYQVIIVSSSSQPTAVSSAVAAADAAVLPRAAASSQQEVLRGHVAMLEEQLSALLRRRAEADAARLDELARAVEQFQLRGGAAVRLSAELADEVGAVAEILECEYCNEPFDAGERAPQVMLCSHVNCKVCWTSWAQCPVCGPNVRSAGAASLRVRQLVQAHGLLVHVLLPDGLAPLGPRGPRPVVEPKLFRPEIADRPNDKYGRDETPPPSPRASAQRDSDDEGEGEGEDEGEAAERDEEDDSRRRSGSSSASGTSGASGASGAAVDAARRARAGTDGVHGELVAAPGRDRDLGGGSSGTESEDEPEARHQPLRRRSNDGSVDDSEAPRRRSSDGGGDAEARRALPQAAGDDGDKGDGARAGAPVEDDLSASSLSRRGRGGSASVSVISLDSEEPSVTPKARTRSSGGSSSSSRRSSSTSRSALSLSHSADEAAHNTAAPAAAATAAGKRAASHALPGAPPGSSGKRSRLEANKGNGPATSEDVILMLFNPDARDIGAELRRGVVRGSDALELDELDFAYVASVDYSVQGDVSVAWLGGLQALDVLFSVAYEDNGRGFEALASEFLDSETEFAELLRAVAAHGVVHLAIKRGGVWGRAAAAAEEARSRRDP